jgi:mono/diheme cytochrome c family protein
VFGNLPRRVRLIVVPLVLFGLFAGTAFALAEAHFAKPGFLQVSGGNTKLGDPYQGQIAFDQKCGSCHGQGGEGGGIGPKLVGLPLGIARAKAQIDHGSGSMPAHLVTGSQEGDVLAYLSTILKQP